ncbi:pyridoxamine 5'-phosphate oxidase family protein [Streptosporangium sp. NBC_01639]|uniref:pyridoxamine 5'-phosphate oxidase family protein n=1 Tax=Streptosporangium sp. NBC_01639 TaxID=2975948 RepID=UPI00386EC53E|nr:pyridoxamine 5'-phosphate oxidase family protein [Streptosporangium sp. NBC_01639]
MTGHMTAPGDLGRRVAWRREAMGLSREQLAGRARIDSGYLGYLEENAASPAAETVHRLAVALETSTEELLGQTADLPPGRGEAAPHAHLEKLDPQECLRLISPGGVGRIAFNDLGGPVILPVNYALHDGAVVFRTAFGGPLDETLRTGLRGVEFKVAFEVDRIDEARREGWSVLLRGGIHHVSGDVSSDADADADADAERAAAGVSGVDPWAGGDRGLYVKVVPTEVTGRRIRHVE